MPQQPLITRRKFLASATTACFAISLPAAVLGALKKMYHPVKIGIITDLHQDIMHDGEQRLVTFVRHMQKINPNVILQLGDFAYPGDKNRTVIELFNNASHVPLHVIGNHDTDSGYTKEQCVSYWGMPHRYYSYVVEGIRFIILDGNDKGSPSHKGGYPAFIGEEQLNWLKKTLEESLEPIIIATHQPLAGAGEIDNAAEVRKILEHAKNRILLAVNGHTHIDAHLEIKGIHYVHINSASYFWIGEEYKHESYGKEILENHPWIASTCPYEDVLFAILTIDPKRKKLFIEGRKSSWVGKSPAELGYDDPENIKAGKEIVPEIRNRIIEVGRG